MDWQNTLCISWAIPARSCTFTTDLPWWFAVKNPFRCPASSQVEVDHCTERWPCYLQQMEADIISEYFGNEIASALHCFICCGFLLRSFFIVVIPARKYTDQNWARDHKSCLQPCCLSFISCSELLPFLSPQSAWETRCSSKYAFETLDGLRTAWSFTARYAVPTKQLGVMSHSSAPGPRKPLPSFGLGGHRALTAYCKRTEKPAMASELLTLIKSSPQSLQHALVPVLPVSSTHVGRINIKLFDREMETDETGIHFPQSAGKATFSGSWTLPRYICRISRFCWPILITTFRRTAHSAHLGHSAHSSSWHSSWLSPWFPAIPAKPPSSSSRTDPSSKGWTPGDMNDMNMSRLVVDQDHAKSI